VLFIRQNTEPLACLYALQSGERSINPMYFIFPREFRKRVENRILMIM
jgi:hypothetical protein